MNMPDIKFWFFPSACSLAPHVLLHEIGVEFTPIPIALHDGEHLSDEFARINPKKRVPVISVDGQIITELPAIVTAISDLAPERQLIGRNSADHAITYEWLSWLSGTLHGQGFGALWRPERFSADTSAYPGIRSKGALTIEECFNAIEQKLDGAWAVGNEFTVVDPFLFVFYRWGNGIGLNMTTKYPTYTALVHHLIERPAVVDTLTAENLSEFPLNDRQVPGTLPTS